MKKLILALSGANLSNEDIESVLTELKAAFNKELTRKWKPDGINYWSMDTSENNRYFLLNVNTGKFSDIYEYPVYNLRCIRE